MLRDVAPLGLESVKTFTDWINLSKIDKFIEVVDIMLLNKLLDNGKFY